MVSDIVLTGALPDSVRDSVDAYVSCISGAVTKDEYIEAVKAAGFKDAGVFDEISFPVEELISSPAAAEVVEKFNVSKEDAVEAAGSLTSVKVRAVK